MRASDRDVRLRSKFEVCSSKLIAMKPPKSVFACQQCGAQSPKWLGRCPDCGAWNSFVEETRGAGGRDARRRAGDGRRRGAALPGRRYRSSPSASRPASASSIASWAAASCPDRWCCSAASRASASPRCCCRRPRTSPRTSGRCCTAPARNRSTRSRCAASGWASAGRRCICWPRRASSGCIEEIDRVKPALLIVDSIQTVFSLKLQSAPGSVGQVRQAATDLLFTAKGRNLPTILVGHVTKDGSLAGPESARARRRHRAVLRGPAASRASRRARREEPLRRGRANSACSR